MSSASWDSAAHRWASTATSWETTGWQALSCHSPLQLFRGSVWRAGNHHQNCSSRPLSFLLLGSTSLWEHNPEPPNPRTHTAPPPSSPLGQSRLACNPRCPNCLPTSLQTMSLILQQKSFPVGLASLIGTVGCTFAVRPHRQFMCVHLYVCGLPFLPLEKQVCFTVCCHLLLFSHY